MARASTISAPRAAPSVFADHDLNLVLSAIDLVAAGGARRVTLVGLRSPAHLMPRAQTISVNAGLRARGTRRADGAGYDVTVESLR